MWAQGKYVLVTSLNEIKVGEKVIIVSRDSLVAMGTEGTNNRSKVDVYFDDESKSAISEHLNDFQQIQQLEISKGVTGDTYALSTGDKFLNSKEGNKLNTIFSRQKSSSVKISVLDSGIAIIEFQSKHSTRYLKYNGSTAFECYNKTGAVDISLFRYVKDSSSEKEAYFSISSVGYATYYTDQAFRMPEGVEGAIVTATDGQNLSIDYRYTPGSIVPAKTGLLLRGEQGEYRYTTLNSEQVAPAENMLHGLLEDGMTTAEGNVLFYKLANDAVDGLGFYWGAEEGGAFPIAANKAYLAVPKELSTRGFSFKDFETTGINAINSKNAQSGIFDLNGRMINTSNVNLLRQGIYIVNGKKMIVK